MANSCLLFPRRLKLWIALLAAWYAAGPSVLCAKTNRIPDSERAALIAIFRSTQGENWIHTGGWVSQDTGRIGDPGTECDWDGVACDDNGAHVISLALSSNNMKGTLPPELSNLRNLTHIDMSFNSLEDEIPSSLFELQSLEDLDLSHNRLQGRIQCPARDAFSLQELSLANNAISGDLTCISHFPHIRLLVLAANALSGKLPAYIGKNSDLTILDLSGNQFTGTLPPEIGRLAGLSGLFLSHNRLSGQLPIEIGRLSNLQSLDISFNQFSGSLPTSLSHLENLDAFEASHNAFGGTFPVTVCSRSLTHLDLSANHFKGIFPATLKRCSSLTYLNLASNGFEGDFPSALIHLQGLRTLDLSHNHFLGNLPRSLESLSDLEKLNLSHNQFTSNNRGTKWPDLSTLNLDDNRLAGNLPVNGLTRSLEELTVSNNKITGSFPRTICSLKDLQVINLSNNALAGRICGTIGDLEDLKIFNVSHNRLEGNIPPSLLTIKELTALNLSYNHFAGELPSTSSSLSLQIIDLSWNHLSGAIPNWFRDLHFLEFVDVSHNSFRSGCGNLLQSGLRKNIWPDPNAWENCRSGLADEQVSPERKAELSEAVSLINPTTIENVVHPIEFVQEPMRDKDHPKEVTLAKAGPSTTIEITPLGPAATIYGDVVDPTGAQVPGTKVTVDSATITKSAVTDEKGQFAIAMPPGVYKLHVSEQGFLTQDVDNVNVVGDRATIAHVVLQIATSQQTVEASATANVPEGFLGPWWNNWITKDGFPETDRESILEPGGQEYTFYLELSTANQANVASGEQSAEIKQELRDYLANLKMKGTSETSLFIRISVIGRALAPTDRVNPVASWTTSAGWIPQSEPSAAGALTVDLSRVLSGSQSNVSDRSIPLRAGAIRFGLKTVDSGCAAIAVSIWDQTRSLPLDHIVRLVSVGTQAKCSSINSEQAVPGIFSLSANGIAPDVSLHVFEFKVNGESRSAAFMGFRAPSGPCESFHWASDSSIIDLILHSQNFKTVLEEARRTEGVYSSVGEQLADAFFPSRHSSGGCGSADAFSALKAMSQQKDVRLYARISDTNGRLVIVPLGLLSMFTEGGQRVFPHDIRVFQPIARQTLGPTECVKDWVFVLPSALDGITPGDPILDLPDDLVADSRVVRSKQDFLARFVDADGETESQNGLVSVPADSPNGLLLLAHHEDGVLTFSAPGDSMGYTRFDRYLGTGSIAVLSACETTNLTESTKLINRLNTDGVDALVAAAFELNISFGIKFAVNFAETLAQQEGKAIPLDGVFEKAMSQTVSYESKTTSPERARGMSLELVLAGNPELSICPQEKK